jgi:hypothetical protein
MLRVAVASVRDYRVRCLINTSCGQRRVPPKNPETIDELYKSRIIKGPKRLEGCLNQAHGRPSGASEALKRGKRTEWTLEFPRNVTSTG